MLDEIMINITYQDTDIGGLVYHARYLDYAEKGRCKILTDLFGKINCQENTQWVVSSLEIKYIKPSTLGDIILVKTTLLDIKKTSIIFKHTFSVHNDKKVEKKPIPIVSDETHLAYSLDDSGNKLMVKITNQVTGELVRTLEFKNFTTDAHTLSKLAGHLVDHKT